MASPCSCLFSAGSSDSQLQGLCVGSGAWRAEYSRVKQELGVPAPPAQAPLRVLVRAGRGQEIDPRGSGCISAGMLKLGFASKFFPVVQHFFQGVYVFPLSVIKVLKK